jgi:ABC-type nitrate/sulfonate/bicarbonate transport system substrate-binding protein
MKDSIHAWVISKEFGTLIRNAGTKVCVFLGEDGWAHSVCSLSEIKAFVRHSTLMPSQMGLLN